jgi:hypothetical protein
MKVMFDKSWESETGGLWGKSSMVSHIDLSWDIHVKTTQSERVQVETTRKK